VVSRTVRWNIDIKLNSQARTKISNRAVRAFVASVLDSLTPKYIASQTSEVSLVFTGDRSIQRLNRKFRNKDNPTDVLSFPLSDRHRSKLPALGDVVISLETCQKQARLNRVTLGSEVARLLIHGILHLLGHDHEGVSKAKAARMRRLEQKLFKLNHRLTSKLIKN